MTVLSVLSPSKARSNRKPDSRLPIDWSDSLAKGLKFYTTCGRSVIRDSVRGLKGVPVELTWAGQDIEVAVAGQGCVSFPSIANDDVALGNYDFTLMVTGNWGTATGAPGLIARRTGSEPGDGFWQLYVSVTVRFSHYDGSHHQYNFTTISHSQQLATYVLTHNASASEYTLYRLGAGTSPHASETLTGVSPPTGDNNHRLCLGRLISDQDGNGFICTLKEAAIWHRCLPPSEIHSLTKTPLYSRVLVPNFMPTPFKAVAAPPASGTAPILLSNQETICR